MDDMVPSELAPRGDASMSVERVREVSETIIAWSREAHLDPALEALDRAWALENYLRKHDLAQPIMTAERHLERRIGQLLGPSEQGARHDLQPTSARAQRLESSRKREFRLISEHWERVQNVLPCSRAHALLVAKSAEMRRNVEQERQRQQVEQRQQSGRFTGSGVSGGAVAADPEVAVANVNRARQGTVSMNTHRLQSLAASLADFFAENDPEEAGIVSGLVQARGIFEDHLDRDVEELTVTVVELAKMVDEWAGKFREARERVLREAAC